MESLVCLVYTMQSLLLDEVSGLRKNVDQPVMADDVQQGTAKVASWNYKRVSAMWGATTLLTSVTFIAASGWVPRGTIIHRFHCLAASWLGPEG